MVSFFGLKIGGERKKKSSAKEIQISAPQPQHLDDPNAVDNFFDLKYGPNPAYEASVYSLSQQESRQSSSSSIKSKFKGLRVAPFVSNKFGSSMIDLPTPPSLRHHASNPSIGRRWNTGSSTSLSFVPPSFNAMARPSTSDGKGRARLNPLDVHVTQNPKGGFKGPLSPALTLPDEGPGIPSSAALKSPLGQYELKLDLPSDVSSFADFGNFVETAETPAPLRIKKQASTRVLAKPHAGGQSPQKPPSPPLSVDGKDVLANPISDSSKRPESEVRPLSSQSRRDAPSGAKELQNAISSLEPLSLPSPSPTPRASEEKPSTAAHPRPTSSITKKGGAKPIIQNVRAKRDTLTINPQRRRSLQMKIEAMESGNIPPISNIDRPKTSNSGRLLERPPPLTLTTTFRPSDGPRSAPFLQNPMRSLTPTNVRSPLRLEIGATERTGWRDSTNGTFDQPSRIESPTGSSVYDDDDNEDELYEHSPSPESTSPVIPLTGPLASPCFPPLSQSPYSYSSISTLPQGDEIDSDRSPSPTTPPVPRRSSRRVLPTARSSYWPLASPGPPPIDRSAYSPSLAESRLRSESESGSESFSTYEPLEPPRIPSVRSGAESPTFRSFSRPWTPSMGSDFTAPPLKRAETAGQPLGLELGGGLRPPPRSATVRTAKTELGSLNNSAGPSVGGCLNTGFI